MIIHIEHAWLPACQQECCQVDNQNGCWAQEGGFQKMLALEVDHQEETVNVVVISIFSEEERRGTDEW